MATSDWKWKDKDGAKGGLLYESGNWGDILKMLWLSETVRWKRQASAAAINYFDPFAGDIQYPLGRKTRFRLEQGDLPGLDFIRDPFIKKGYWPSSASAAALLAGGRLEVYDADAGRRGNWQGSADFALLEGESGWDILREKDVDPAAIWLIDPYDFLAEWRQILPLLLEKARATSLLLYMYNRSARSDETFREYRAFRSALDAAWDAAPKRFGRVAADVFLPRAHHEMLFLPSLADSRREGFAPLLQRLGELAFAVTAAVNRAAVFDG